MATGGIEFEQASSVMKQISQFKSIQNYEFTMAKLYYFAQNFQILKLLPTKLITPPGLIWFSEHHRRRYQTFFNSH